MEFRKCSVGGKSFGLGTTEIGRALLKRKGLPIPEEPKQSFGRKTPNVNFTDPDLWIVLGNSQHELNRPAKLFFLSLALNHDVMPEEKNGEITYSASSPDEAALVYAAKHFGFFFKRREMERITIEIDNKDVVFNVLHILEFSSDRKRSSVITEEDGKYMLYCKGADNVIKARLSKEKTSAKRLAETETQLLQYVDDGLRTLLVAFKEIPKEKYLYFAKQLHNAETSITDREAKIEEVADRIEQDLELLGVTAIEDKLQNGVPECLTALREGGIKVWMLTGDKVGTAINIGYSCSLLTTEMQLLRLCVEDQNIDTGTDGNPSKQGMQKRLEELRAETKYCVTKVFALVVDTGAVAALTEFELTEEFIELCKICKSVVCARVSPRQKATIVELVREASPETVTLSIGDGANDVPMIQTAHVGIGIHGLEGQQAVNSSDFSIGQFSFLKRLLLVHGRWNYRRLCKVIKYMFYKNAVLVLPQWLYGFYSLYGGQAFYFDIFYQLFNVAFTALPIIGLGVMDQDVSDKVIEKFPVFYQDGIQRVFLNRRLFWLWMLEAASHAMFIYFMMVCTFGTSQWSTNGQDLGVFELGTTIYLIVVAVCQARLMFETSMFTPIMIAFYSISLFLWWICWLTMSSWIGMGFQVYGSIDVVTHTASFWFGVIFAVVICFVISMLIEALQVMAFPRRNHIGREMMAGFINGKQIEDPLEKSDVMQSAMPKQSIHSLRKIYNQLNRSTKSYNSSDEYRSPRTEALREGTEPQFDEVSKQRSSKSFNQKKSFELEMDDEIKVDTGEMEAKTSYPSLKELNSAAAATFLEDSLASTPREKFTAVLPKIEDVEEGCSSRSVSEKYSEASKSKNERDSASTKSRLEKLSESSRNPKDMEEKKQDDSSSEVLGSAISSRRRLSEGTESDYTLSDKSETMSIISEMSVSKRPNLKAPRKSCSVSHRASAISDQFSIDDMPMFLQERQPSFKSGAKRFRKGLSMDMGTSKVTSPSKPSLGKKDSVKRSGSAM